MGYANLIYRFLRLGPLGLGLIAVAILVGGYFLQVEMNKSAAKDAVALAEGPPDTVDIADFDKSRDMSDIREVMVQAQPVLDFAYRLTIERKGTDDHVFMVPLVAADGHSETDILGIAYFTSPNEDFDNITPDLLMRGMSGFGTVGPVITYNGKLRSMGSWDDLTEEAFFDEGLVMPSNPIVVWPFMEAREVALAPPAAGDLTVFGLLSKLAGAIGLLALGKLVFRKDAPVQPEPTMMEPARVQMPTLQADLHHDVAAQPASNVPLWKQRSGLGDDGAADNDAQFAQSFEPTYAPEPAPVQPTFEEPVLETPRRKFGVRKVLIGLIGGLFAIGLVSTIGDLIASSSPAQEVVAIPTAEERVAAAVADVIVPDAPSDRHWTDIDVTPVIEWVTAKALLAIAGDTDAIMTLGMIVLGVFVLVFGAWWYLVLRRRFSPRVTGRFDSMGIN